MGLEPVLCDRSSPAVSGPSATVRSAPLTATRQSVRGNEGLEQPTQSQSVLKTQNKKD